MPKLLAFPFSILQNLDKIIEGKSQNLYKYRSGQFQINKDTQKQKRTIIQYALLYYHMQHAHSSIPATSYR